MTAGTVTYTLQMSECIPSVCQMADLVTLLENSASLECSNKCVQTCAYCASSHPLTVSHTRARARVHAQVLKLLLQYVWRDVQLAGNYENLPRTQSR